MLPPAAEQLIEQVQQHREDATYETAGDPDGFGRHREIVFDTDTGQWLEPILAALEDERIAEYDSRDDGLWVRFVADVRADERDEFEIDDADQVLDEDEEEESEGQ